MENIKYANNLASDAFTKRETAAEELYIRQEEKAKYVYEPLANASIPASFTFPTKEQMGNWWRDCADGIIRLLAIKEKLKQQRQHIEDLDKHMSVPH
jgi:hypothetical protein